MRDVHEHQMKFFFLKTGDASNPLPEKQGMNKFFISNFNEHKQKKITPPPPPKTVSSHHYRQNDDSERYFTNIIDAQNGKTMGDASR